MKWINLDNSMGCKITRSLHVNTVLSHFIKIVGPIAESFITDFEEYKKECVEFVDIPIPTFIL